jgi:hypothetical protein
VPSQAESCSTQKRRTPARTGHAATDVGWNKGKSQVVSGVHYRLNVITMKVIFSNQIHASTKEFR